mgnify:CR=1 FL=1
MSNLISNYQTAKEFANKQRASLYDLFDKLDNAESEEYRKFYKQMIKRNKKLLRKNKKMMAEIEIKLTMSAPLN